LLEKKKETLEEPLWK